jgi:aldose 1-epimerase
VSITPPEGTSALDGTPFGKLPDGSAVLLYGLRNSNGIAVAISSYGAAIVSIIAPDCRNQFSEVVLGCGDVASYLGRPGYLGAIVGRYANRINGGKFVLDGQSYALATNNGTNHLHGGVRGFDKVLWNVAPVSDPNGAALKLAYLSRDGEEGYPGNLAVTVEYTLSDSDALTIDYTATTDRATIVNLSNHSYFNLAGSGNILQHRLRISADRFTPIVAGHIPTGELRDVTGTPFDFRGSKAIGADLHADDEQLELGAGYDHNFVLNKNGDELALAAEVYEGSSGRSMKMFTTEPGLQFYSGNFLDGRIAGSDGRLFGRHSGFCLEAQHFPDSPNQPAFPPTVLRPGQTYRQTTVYQFSVR